MGLSVRDMAGQLGVSKSQVQRDKDEGMPMDSVDAARVWREKNRDVARSADGRIDRPAATHITPAAVGGVAPAARGGEVDASPPSSDDAPPTPTDTEEYRGYRTERERIRRDREALELDQQRGRLVDAAEAARLAFTTFRRLRDQCLNLWPGLAAQFAGMTDPLAIERLGEAETAKLFGRFDEAALLRDPDDEDDEPG